MTLWTCFLHFFLLRSFVLTSTERRVFQSQPEASAVLQRSRRANIFFIEEILQGNLERECYEERCDYEEAREYFEDIPKTDVFWAVYYDGDQCKPNPCLNGARCTDSIGGYNCECKELYNGVNCEKDVAECHPEGPLSCDHFCRPTFTSYHCHCADGYKIQPDGKTCQPEVQYPCGRTPVHESSERNQTIMRSSSGSHHCLHGRCPWQVSLLDSRGHEFCSGVILGERSVLTAAACVSKAKSFTVELAGQTTDLGSLGEWSQGGRRPGQRPHIIEGPGQILSVSHTSIHKRYQADQPEHDLAFLQLQKSIRFSPTAFQICLPEKDFSENVLMRVGREGLLAGWEPAETKSSPDILSYMPLEECQTSYNLSIHLTNKMFCMLGRDSRWSKERAGCGALPGSPVVTVEKDTVFLTGLLISPEMQNCTQVHAFTKLSRYLPWLKQHLAHPEE
ncbi:protein Z, vitamin K-dependent plasma glycoprotein b isoform X2 [Megalops cyprinoides]|uniref:protein Z, vitamin K-dependent plasma glycoprotein b isoform X2 n=1 Tax=Megalops cyprinoides TaxID=118141 RepID=UPI0018652986|nr:protein Z, vitamin K-dependent plasma glycoprotein b isoform X2 [Megalops cyprinoides]